MQVLFLAAKSEPHEPIWLPILISAITAITSVIAAFIAGHYAKRSRPSKNEAQRLSELEARISEKKYETYRPMVALLGDLLNKERQAALLNGNGISPQLHESATWASIYASDEAFRCFRNWMQASFTGAPGEVLLRLYYEFVLAAQRDIEQADTNTSLEEILSARINDLYADDGFLWIVNEPFDEVCRRTEWSAPWARSDKAQTSLNTNRRNQK